MSSNVEVIAKESSESTRRLFVDCGVNEEVVLKKFSRMLPHFDFVGFEAQDELVARARKANPRAQIRHEAVSDTAEDITLWIPKSYSQNFRGRASTEPTQVSADNVHSTRRVSAIRLTDFLAEKRDEGYDYICIKMDIEGSEYRIISDLHRRFLANGNSLLDHLMVEFHPGVLDSPEEHDSYLKKLAEMGIQPSPWD